MVTDQFSGMADMLEELAADFALEERLDADAAARVSDVCEAHGLSVRDVVCAVGREGRMTVDILASDKGSRVHEKKWRGDIGGGLWTDVRPSRRGPDGDVIRITLTEQPLYRVSVGERPALLRGREALRRRVRELSGQRRAAGHGPQRRHAAAAGRPWTVPWRRG